MIQTTSENHLFHTTLCFIPFTKRLQLNIMNLSINLKEALWVDSTHNKGVYFIK